MNIPVNSYSSVYSSVGLAVPRRRRKKKWFSLKADSLEDFPKLNFWITVFIFGIFGSQLLLIPQELFPYRTYIRILYFLCSLVLVVIVPGKTKMLPITGLSIFILAYYCLQLFNPNSDSAIAAVASILLNYAIIAPIIWIPRLRMDTGQFKIAMIMIWAFHTGSAGLGILEVTYPSQFQRESKITESKGRVEALQIELSDGTRVYRPMGFTDSPGGAAFSGYIAVLMSCCFLLMRFPWYFQAVCMLSILAGIFSILICHVRSTLVLATLCQGILFVVLTMRGQLLRGAKLLVFFLLMGGIATIFSLVVGGERTLNRALSLFEASPDEVYYSNRGYFIDHTLHYLIPEIPLGAGLGKWGQIHQYFGGYDGSEEGPYHVEVQLTGWILDGGLPMAIAYYLAIFLCIKYSFEMSFHRNRTIADLSMLVLTLNVAVFANTFSYVPFIGQTGMFFWLMNGCLMALTLTDHQISKIKRQRMNQQRWAALMGARSGR